MYAHRVYLIYNLSDFFFFLIKHVFLYEKTGGLVRSKCNLEKKTRKLHEPFIEKKRIKMHVFQSNSKFALIIV